MLLHQYDFVTSSTCLVNNTLISVQVPLASYVYLLVKSNNRPNRHRVDWNVVMISQVRWALRPSLTARVSAYSAVESLKRPLKSRKRTGNLPF